MNPKYFSRLCCAALALFVSIHLHAADGKPAVALKLVAEGLVSPLNLLTLDDGSGRLLIADQVGTIHVLGKDGKLAEQLFLDVRPKLTKLNNGFDERGLLGLALHPKFKQNRKLYVYYSAPKREGSPEKWDHTSHLSEFKVMAEDFAKVDPASERVLLAIDEPQSNHNGGRLAFGPDGFLYIGVGDGGGANDNEMGHPDTGNGQNPQVLLGKILRLDVDKGEPYGIPRDNPFADGVKGRKEIYSWGWRNPWGISFDRGGARELFAVDVGQALYEELNIVVKGGNYGWRVRESFVAFDPKAPNQPPTNAPTKDAFGQPFIDPIADYKHPGRGKLDPTVLQGISVTGGYVYRGKALPALQGRYVFGDWSRSWALPDGVLFTATRGEGKKWRWIFSRSPSRPTKWALDFLPITEPANGKIGAYIVAFGEDADGELYVLTNSRNGLLGPNGKVFKLVP